jgi:hypothetical protein
MAVLFGWWWCKMQCPGLCIQMRMHPAPLQPHLLMVQCWVAPVLPLPCTPSQPRRSFQLYPVWLQSRTPAAHQVLGSAARVSGRILLPLRAPLALVKVSQAQMKSQLGGSKQRLGRLSL